MTYFYFHFLQFLKAAVIVHCMLVVFAVVKKQKTLQRDNCNIASVDFWEIDNQ